MNARSALNSVSNTSTILAISTAPGAGAVGLIRLSGPAVLALLKRHCRTPTAQIPDFAGTPRHAHFCRICKDGRPEDALDEVLVTFFPGPASYTGEDIAEIGAHGNPILLREILNELLEGARRNGDDLRPAGPGEFTQRAYLNGRMELTRAEAVHRIVTARSQLELEASRKNLYGELSRMVSRFRSAIIHLKAETEAEVDFSTEDLTFESLEQRRKRVADLLTRIDALIERGRETERLRAGIQVALVGVPNAGKSSLMNRMLGWDRAIVSPVAGTTRDYLSEEIQFEGVALRFVDTAGLRETDDVIEEQGVRLSQQTMQQSQIVLHVIDGERPAYEFPELHTPGIVVHVFNKVDLRAAYASTPEYQARVGEERYVNVSCTNGEGLDELRRILRDLVFENAEVARDPLLLEDRHRHHLEHVRQALQRVLELWDQGAPDEITALEIDRALEHTGAIAGRIDNEEILGRIFSVFCVGK